MIIDPPPTTTKTKSVGEQDDARQSPILFSHRKQGTDLADKLTKRHSSPMFFKPTPSFSQQRRSSVSTDSTWLTGSHLKSVNFVLLGATAVGKSALLSQFVHNKLIEDHEPTMSDIQTFMVQLPGELHCSTWYFCGHCVIV